MQLEFGKYGQVSFRSLDDYYFALGYLSNSNHAVIRWEHNEDQGAWGSEGRILFKADPDEIPPFFKLTAGTGGTTARTNCNEYVERLVRVHLFKEYNDASNVRSIESTVPQNYLNQFRAGFRL